ncbi:MAG: DUF1330 domain-containing protein [Gammaproteobacteria bacterium]
MAAYWVARCHIINQEEYSKYAELAGPAIEFHGGKFLARGGKQVEVEGGVYERTVLVEFESLEQAQKCYDSPEYREAFKFQENAAERHVVIVEGV